MRHIGPCMCGATDCPSCGPAQGYTVVKRWNPLAGRYTWTNPDEDTLDENEDSIVDDREPDYEHREVYEPIEAEWARWRE